MTLDPAYLSELEKKYGLPSGLLATQMKVESGGDPSAISPKGALGAFQFMPETAKQYGIDPLDPVQAAEGAARMNADLLKKYDGDVPSALAAYNWGQGNVDRKGLGKMPAETSNYIEKIMGRIGDAIIPSANAQDLPEGFVPFQQEDTSIVAQELTDAPTGFVPSGTEDVRPATLTKEEMQTNVARSMGSEGFGLPATLTAYGANAIDMIPFLGEAGSAIASAMGAGQGETFKDRYDFLQQAQQVMREEGSRRSPTGTALGQIGSALLTVPFAPTSAPKAATSALSAIGKGALSGAGVGAGYGALYGAADTDAFLKDDYATSQRLENMASGAAGGAALGAPLGALSGGLSYKLAGSPKPVTAEGLRKQAGQTLKASDEAGATIKAEGVNNWIKEIEGATPQTQAGRLVSGKSESTKLIEDITGKGGLKDKPMNLQEAKEVYEGIADRIDEFVDPVTGKLLKQGQKLFDIQTKFRNMLTTAEEKGLVEGSGEGLKLWEKGREEWARSMRLGDIERIMQRAEVADNPAIIMKNGFGTLYKNKARFKQFTTAEQNLIKKAATANLAVEALRGMGSRLVSIIAFGSGNPALGLAAQGGSALSRKAAGAAQASRAQAVIDEIAGTPKLSPIAQRAGVASGAASKK